VEKVDPPGDVDSMRCDSQEFPPPTGQVQDRLLTCSGQEYIINTQYILREDGSLWQWKIEIYPYFQLARALGLFVLSIVVGLAAGLFLVAARRRNANS